METFVQTTASRLAEPWPEDGLETVTTCPACGSADREPLHEGLQDRVFFCAPGVWTMYRCLACNSGYLDPRPTPGTIALAYSSYFTHATSKPPVEALSTMRRLRRAMANGYRNARFELNRTPSIALGAWMARFLPGYRAILDTEVRHLPKAWAGAKLLDVGCGNGEFLELATVMGWQADGLDFDPQAVDVARRHGCAVYQGGIEVLRDRAEYYDVVTLSHVIEHVHDPSALLADCFRLLRPGGRLWLDTPNLESAGHARYGRHWRGLEPPRHLVLFTWTSLERALIRNGFTDVRPMPLRPLAREIFAASEAIRQQKDPYREGKTSPSIRWHARRAERRASTRLSDREFITLVARKPQ